MCTVTYIPINKTDFILTSNRDVPFKREKALFPKEYNESGVAITYPKDGKAGGTWIGYSDKKRLICLLNGGFKNHYLTVKPNIKYRKSRGLIVLDLLKEVEINVALNNINLNNIEPFTLVIVDWNTDLHSIEFIWDGELKHIKKLPQKEHIWSSATLYNDKMKQMREDWFTENKEYDAKSILVFHKHAGIGNPEINVLMKRKKVGTVSITQVHKIDDVVTMDYNEIK